MLHVPFDMMTMAFVLLVPISGLKWDKAPLTTILEPSILKIWTIPESKPSFSAEVFQNQKTV